MRSLVTGRDTRAVGGEDEVRMEAPTEERCHARPPRLRGERMDEDGEVEVEEEEEEEVAPDRLSLPQVEVPVEE